MSNFYGSCDRLKKLLLTGGSVSIICLGGLLMTASCGGNNDNNTESSSQTGDSLTPDPTDVVMSVVAGDPVKPANHVLYFDASVSMRGYVDATKSGNFSAVVGKLNNVSQSGSAYVFDNERHQVQNFLSKFQNKDINWATESDIFAMVRETINGALSNPNDCYILVTDGIISGSNSQIRADRSYNISKPHMLSSRIDSIVQSIPVDKHVSLMVANFSAPFNGKYYYYDNDTVYLKNEERPFYVIVAGQAPQVSYVEKSLREIPGAKTVQYGTIYPVTMTANGKINGKNTYLIDKKIKDEGLKAELTVKSLPDYARNLAYLTKNLEVVKLGSGRAATSRTLKVDDDYTLVLEGDKLMVDFSEKIKNQLPADFEFRIKRIQPVWVADATTLDDKKGYSPNKTLNLKYFLDPFLRLNGSEYLNDIEQSKLKVVKK